MRSDYIDDLSQVEKIEAHARRHELIAILIRDGRAHLSVIRDHARKWCAPDCTRKGALESVTFSRSSLDFMDACYLAGFDGAQELADVRTRAAKGGAKAP